MERKNLIMNKNTDDFEMLESVENESLLPGVSSNRTHDVKIAINELMKISTNSKIPIFVAYYDPGKGYVYNGMLPQELNSPDLVDQYDRFWKFLKLCIDFNRDDYKPVIKSNDD